jgi:hypothetical protein
MLAILAALVHFAVYFVFLTLGLGLVLVLIFDPHAWAAYFFICLACAIVRFIGRRRGYFLPRH